MKEMNRVNKIDQAKALKDMQKNVQSDKNLLLTKAETAQQRKFIIWYFFSILFSIFNFLTSLDS